MIKVQDVVKNYGPVEALRGVSFEIRKGEIVGFLGPNGAGKTTALKIMTGYLAPTSGSVSIAGFDVQAQSLQTRAKIGYLPENAPLYTDMSVHEYLSYVAELRRIPADRRAAQVRDIAAMTGIGDVIQRNIGELSKGYRQRVGLAQAMIHDPEILILDEPTVGLDPNQIVEIRRLIQRIGKERTIILSTHILPEVLQTCDRILIVHRGRIVADGSVAELERRETENPLVVVRLKADAAPAVVAERLRTLPGVQAVKSREPDRDGIAGYALHTAGAEDVRPAVFGLARSENWTLFELRRDMLDIEGIFRKLTQQ